MCSCPRYTWMKDPFLSILNYALAFMSAVTAPQFLPHSYLKQLWVEMPQTECNSSFSYNSKKSKYTYNYSLVQNKLPKPVRSLVPVVQYCLLWPIVGFQDTRLSENLELEMTGNKPCECKGCSTVTHSPSLWCSGMIPEWKIHVQVL